MPEISFETSRVEDAVIHKIVDRYIDKFPRSDYRMSLEMDLAAVHCNGCELDFKKLLEFDDFNFVHDIDGIMRNLDRDDDSPTGGQLLHCFLPRCALPQRREA